MGSSSDPEPDPLVRSDHEGASAGARVRRRAPEDAVTLREAWRRNAAEWINWARTPMHDSYWRFHRDEFLTLVPGPGTLTVDIGAGEGRLTRELGRRGHRVVAIDASPTLAHAAGEADVSTSIVVADAAALPLRSHVADLAVAFMSLQDVDDLDGAVREAARVLQPGGRLCIAVVHPLNSAGQFEDDDADARFIIDGAYLQSRLYVDEVQRDGLTMEFASAHRPLQVYAAACSDAGFLIEHVREPAIPDEAVRSPRQRRWQRVPLFLHIRAIRP